MGDIMESDTAIVEIPQENTTRCDLLTAGWLPFCLGSVKADMVSVKLRSQLLKT